MTRPREGIAETLAPGIRRVLAPNPSPMTYWGTNTYIIGTNDVAVIDPGPDLDKHLDAIMSAVGSGRVSGIFVTHAHKDHTTLAPRLHAATGAPISAFGTAYAGRSELMTQLAADGLTGGGEGVDADFRPHRTMKDGDTVSTDEWSLKAIHTPGHFAGHLSFQCGDALFSGDHIMDWSTTIISPPDGDLTAFMASTRRLQSLSIGQLLPGHGLPVTDPKTRLAELLKHRLSREEQILAVLSDTGMTLKSITRAVYTELDPALLPAAARNTLAHLIDLAQRNQVAATPRLTENALFVRL